MRARRRLAVDGAAYEALDAWSSASGLTLCYFRALDGESAETIDRGDRRAALEADEDLSETNEERLAELLGTGSPLTETERRIDTPDGGSWLVQSMGPVWAEGVAAGLTGVMFTDLTGSAPRVRVAGGPIVPLSTDELLALWAESLREPDPHSQTPQ